MRVMVYPYLHTINWY